MKIIWWIMTSIFSMKWNRTEDRKLPENIVHSTRHEISILVLHICGSALDLIINIKKQKIIF